MTPQERLQDAEDRYYAFRSEANKNATRDSLKDVEETLSLLAEVEEAEANLGCALTGEAIATGSVPWLVSEIGDDVVIRINKDILSKIVADYGDGAKDRDLYRMVARKSDMVPMLAAIVVLRKMVGGS